MIHLASRWILTYVYANKLQICDESFHIQSDADHMRTLSNEMQRVGGFQRRYKLKIFPFPGCYLPRTGCCSELGKTGLLLCCLTWVRKCAAWPISSGNYYNKMLILGLGSYDLLGLVYNSPPLAWPTTSVSV